MAFDWQALLTPAITGLVSGGVAGSLGAQFLKNGAARKRELRADRKRHLDDLGASIEHMELTGEGTFARLAGTQAYLAIETSMTRSAKRALAGAADISENPADTHLTLILKKEMGRLRAKWGLV